MKKNKQKKIVFLDRATFPKKINIPKLDFRADWINYQFTMPSEVKRRINTANIIITNKVELNRTNLSNARNLELDGSA